MFSCIDENAFIDYIVKSILKFSFYLSDLSKMTRNMLVSHYNHVFGSFPLYIHVP